MPVTADPAIPAAPASPPGLSAHARALWRRADKYRRLAEELARADGRAARP